MAYIQKTKKEIMENLTSEANSFSRQSSTGQEIMANQRQLSLNKQQQNLEMNSYVNSFRNQMGISNRVTTKARAQGKSGGTALYNQQNATNELGQNLAQTQNNYQEFTKNTDKQYDQYNENMETLETQAKGEIVEPKYEKETMENQESAQKAAKTASSISTGVGVVGTALSLGIGATGVGLPVAMAIKAASSVIQGIASGTASALQAGAAGADTGAQVAAGFLSGGISAGLGFIGGGASSTSAGKGTMEVGKELSKELGKTTALKSSEAAAGEVAKTGVKEATKTGVGVATENIAKEVGGSKVSLVDNILNDVMNTPDIKTKTGAIINKFDAGAQGSYEQHIKDTLRPQLEQIQNSASAEASKLGLPHDSKQYSDFVSKQVTSDFKKLEPNLNANLRADYNKLRKENMGSWKNKIAGIVKTDKAKLSLIDRYKTGEIGVKQLGLRTGLRVGTAQTVNYFAQNMAVTGVTKKSLNKNTKEKYGSIFDEINRPDLKGKYGL